MNKIQILRTSNTYKRFVRVPAALSVGVSLALFFNLVCLSWMATNGTWAGVFMFGLLFASSFFIADMAAGYTNMVLMRQRLWLWVKDKFDTWEEFDAWMKKTPPMELERLAGLPDDSWSPE